MSLPLKIFCCWSRAAKRTMIHAGPLGKGMWRGAVLAALCLAAPVALAASGAPSVQIRGVEIAQGGRWRPDCQAPRLTRASAMRWFRRAREITRQHWLTAQDPRSCSASGRLTTIYGARYRWEVDQAGRGRIILSPTASVFLAGPRFPDADP